MFHHHTRRHTVTQYGQKMLAVVGYQTRVCDAGYPSVYVFGMYDSASAAVDRQRQLCGNRMVAMRNCTLCKGGEYTTWIKRVPVNEPMRMSINGGMTPLEELGLPADLYLAPSVSRIA
jgi:hypothetical protein